MKRHDIKLNAAGFRFAIVASRFNEQITEGLLEGAVACLRSHGADDDQIDLYRVPGAFEVPMTVAKLASSGRFDAIVTIGALVRGETPHFDHISSQVTHAISSVSIDRAIPISFGVITCETMEQAIARSTGGSNKGWEAALAAIEMVNLWKEIETVG